MPGAISELQLPPAGHFLPNPRRPRPTSWVALTGFMGTGKSRVGWELARQLSLYFVDTDRLIERATGRSVSQIFAEQGEAAFRELELELVRRVTGADLLVVALGGGTFIQPACRQLLRARGPVVALEARPETVLARTRRSERPLLQTEDPLGTIERLMRERAGTYALADLRVSSEGRQSQEVARRIIAELWRWRRQAERAGRPPGVHR